MPGYHFYCLILQVEKAASLTVDERSPGIALFVHDVAEIQGGGSGGVRFGRVGQGDFLQGGHVAEVPGDHAAHIGAAIRCRHERQARRQGIGDHHILRRFIFVVDHLDGELRVFARSNSGRRG